MILGILLFHAANAHQVKERRQNQKQEVFYEYTQIIPRGRLSQNM